MEKAAAIGTDGGVYVVGTGMGLEAKAWRRERKRATVIMGLGVHGVRPPLSSPPSVHRNARFLNS